jgi:superfamily I DNA/RNA helicase/RecB family exonuclease
VTAAEPAYRLVRGAGRAGGEPALDVAQRAVVAHPGGPLLVLAGPGTGKTTTLVEAVVDRIAGRGVHPERVLVLTFSRRAAAELRERITARLARTTREPLARTFHSYAFGILRRQAAQRGEPVPRLLSGPEQDLLIRDLLAGDVADGAAGWPAALRPALLTRGFAQELRDLLLRAVERGVPPDRLAAYGQRLGRDDWPAVAAFARQYEDVTALAGLLSGSPAYDPAELIRACVDAFRADPRLLERERAARRHVFVDEYQDVDPAQEELLELLGAGAEELVVVGDPDQSIYGFRGADPGAIRRFADRFPGPDGTAPATLALTVSRRAGAALLGASRRVADRLTGPATHRALVPAVRLPAGRAEAHVFRSASEEAAYVAHRLRAAHLRGGLAWRDMAVLLRSTGRHLGPLRRALVAAGVPVAVAADDIPLIGQSGVAPLLLLLRTALRGDLDEAAAVELLCSPLGGADVLGVRRLRQELRRLEVAAGGGRPSGPLLVEALTEPASLTVLPAWVARPAQRIARLMATVRAAAGTAGATAEDVLWEVWSTAGLAEVWQRASRRGGVLGAAADRDLDAVVALFEAAARFTDRLPGAGAAAFLQHLEGQQIPGDTLAARAPDGDAVRILTAHAAKGLQWPFVVVAGVTEGSWPDLRRRGSLLGAEDLVDLVAGVEPGAAAPVAAQLAEERRLFYVAVTRASRAVVVTAVSTEDEQPSRFLDELDPRPGGREPTAVPRTLSLPALVAELRSVVTDEAEPAVRREAAAAELARLARAGVPGAHPDSWWGLAPLSDDRPLHEPDEPVRVSPSRIEAFAACELRWLLESVGGRSAASASQSLGMLVHELAAVTGSAELHGAAAVGEEELGRRLDEAWGTLDFGGPWYARKERDRAGGMLRRFLEWLADSRGSLELVGVEEEFEVPVGPARLHGRVDRLERDRAGRLLVVDLKTGKSAPTDGEVARHPQLGAYQAAVDAGAFAPPADPPADPAAGSAPAEGGASRAAELRRQLAAPPAPAGVSGGAMLVQLGGTAKKVRVQKQPALAEDGSPAWARDLVVGVAERMAGSAFTAIANHRCDTCPVRRSCPLRAEGRQVTG